MHFTDSGVASWYDFACAIQELSLQRGLLKDRVPVLPISTADFPTPAKRPGLSILDKSKTWAILGGPGDHWRSTLGLMLDRYRACDVCPQGAGLGLFRRFRHGGGDAGHGLASVLHFLFAPARFGEKFRSGHPAECFGGG